MKRIAFGIFIIIVIAGLAVSGCARKQSDDNKILARVSSDFITLGEFNTKIAKMPPYYRNIVEKNKKRYLDEMIMESLLYEEAVRKGLDRDPEVRDVISEAKKKILIAKLVKSEVEDRLNSIDEQEMRQFYEAHKEEFKTPMLWRASHILVSNEREAKDVMDALDRGEDFGELARKHSIDATADRLGDIGYFRAGQLIGDFEKACMKLDVGQTSGIVHTQFGYHIIRLTDKKEPTVESYDKIKVAIEGDLKKRKRSELFDELVLNLKKKYGVEIKDDVFKLLDAAKPENEKVSP